MQSLTNLKCFLPDIYDLSSAKNIFDMLATAELGAWSKKLLICWFINNSSMTIAATTRIAYEPINAYLSGGGLQIRPTLGLVKPTIDIISNVLAKYCGTDLLGVKMFFERSSKESASSQYTLYYFYHFPLRRLCTVKPSKQWWQSQRCSPKSRLSWWYSCLATLNQ